MTLGSGTAALKSRLDRERLSAYLKKVRSTPAVVGEDLPFRRPGEQVEATDAQLQIWLHAEMAQAPLYNEPVTIHYDGELDVEAFEHAFNCVLARHEAWRTSFIWEDGKLLQIVAPELNVKIRAVDLSALSKEKRESAMQREASADASGRFALDRLPLFRYRLFKLKEDRYRFYLTLHHIIFDGVSLYRIFLPELQSYYAAFANRSTLNLPPLQHQYGDYALALKQRSDAERARLRSYWAEVFARPVEPLRLPLDFPRPEVRTFAGEMAVFALSKELSVALRKVAESTSATLFGLLLSAFHVLLYSYTGARDQSIGTAVSSRKQRATEQMLGLFLNTVVLRSSLEASLSFVDFIKIVQKTIVEGLMHDDISFGELVAEFEPDRKSGFNPLFQVMFSLEPPLAPMSRGWRFTQMDIETRLSKYDIHLEMDEREEGLIGRFLYSVELFRSSTMEAWKARWLELLRLVTIHPEWTIEQMVASLERQTSFGVRSTSGFWRKAQSFLSGRRN
jgi:hypothetical protein